MNILMVISNFSLDFGGGASERCSLVARLINNNFYRFSIVTCKFKLDKSRIDSHKPIPIYIFNSIFNNLIPLPNFIKMNLLVKKSDIIFLHNHWSLLNLYFLIYGIFCDKKIIFAPLGGLNREVVFNFKKFIFNLFFTNFFLRNSDLILAVNKREASQLIKIGALNTKTYIIPNFINLGDYKKIGKNKLIFEYILFVGRLAHIKGADILLDSFVSISSKYPALNLVFMGQDEGLKEKLVMSANRSLIAHRIHFLGFLNGAKKNSIYKGAKLIVVPSRSEAMSIVAVEAGIFSKPLIITENCGFDDISRYGAGVVVRPNAIEISAAICNLVDDSSLSKQLATNLNVLVIQSYTIENIARKYREIFRKLSL
jgi:glycosyltransferase involved in cell wall biosynthesis